MIRQTTFLLIFLHCVLSAAEEQWVVSSHGMNVPFHSWRDDGAEVATGVLVLVPGYNGKGEHMMDAQWKAFATKYHLVLLAPTFHAEGHENNQGKGYYYPEQGSGEVMEKALAELKKRTGAETEKVLFFGFSAGAHFSHRFALWRPRRVKAFVAYSAGWWSEPTVQLRSVPALVMCGETDERYAATFDFFKRGQRLQCPWIWRSYKNTGHVMTPTVRNMAEVFLGYHSQNGAHQQPILRYGDIQTFKSASQVDKESVAEEFRIELPSREVADAWEKENE
jgi:pimeloyl-ACP methyl ester carboxylesterase